MEPDQDFADRLEIFFGEASDTQCHVYARLRGPEAGQGLQLSGSLTGPTCLYAQTLPARFAFKDRGPGASVLAEAIVPEPCFWTPEMPHLYQAEVQLLQDGRALARAERPLGIRRLGVHNRDLIYDGKRWVLRGLCREKLPPTELAAWNESDTTMVVRNPDDELCREASRVGVLIVARLKHNETREIVRLSRWPAVAMVALDDRASIDQAEVPRNLLLAQEFTGSAPLRPMPWAQVVLYDDIYNLRGFSEKDTPKWMPLVKHHEPGLSKKSVDQIANSQIPVIVTRIHSIPRSLSAISIGRAWCDAIQSELASRSDLAGCEFAGYIV